VWFSHAPDTGISVRGAWLPPLADSVPIISSISPVGGSVGDFITINGTGFGSNAEPCRSRLAVRMPRCTASPMAGRAACRKK
jgi:hypothetical protein